MNEDTGVRLELFEDAMTLIEEEKVAWSQKTYGVIGEALLGPMIPGCKCDSCEDAREIAALAMKMDCRTAACLCGHVALLDPEVEVVYDERGDAKGVRFIGKTPENMLPYRSNEGNPVIDFPYYGEYRLGQSGLTLFNATNTKEELRVGVDAAKRGEDVNEAIMAYQATEGE